MRYFYLALLMFAIVSGCSQGSQASAVNLKEIDAKIEEINAKIGLKCVELGYLCGQTGESLESCQAKAAVILDDVSRG